MRKHLYSISILLTTISFVSVSAQPSAVLDISLPQPQGETRMWTPLFQASWDNMKAKNPGKLIKIVPPNPLIRRLETFVWNKQATLPPDGHAIFSGHDTPEFTQRVTQAMRERFGMRLAPRTHPHNPLAMAHYGALSRNLIFKKQFYKSKHLPLTFNDGSGNLHQVHFFGTAKSHSGAYGKDVRIIHYNPEPRSFILAVNTSTPGEKVIFYLPSKSLSFDSGITDVANALKKTTATATATATVTARSHQPKKPYLHSGDIIKIPYISINTSTDLSGNLAGKRFYDQPPSPRAVNWAYQTTQFKLTESGARIDLQTGLNDPFGSIPNPRQLVFDRPFFIFTWRDDAQLPYFAAWINCKDVLLPFPRRADPRTP